MKYVYLLLISIGSFSARSQNSQIPTFTALATNSQFSDFILSLKKQRCNSEIKALKDLSHKAHHLFLKRYTPYAQVNDIFTKGNYDCLSGTYFFCAALDQLGFEYRIIETNYHIFLMVRIKNKEVLLESTDRVYGLVTNQKEVRERIAFYQNGISRNSSENLYLADLEMFQELLPQQLPGLFYFNLAVEAYNNKNLKECFMYLEKAWSTYDNPRIMKFTPILLRSILQSNLEASQRELLIEQLKFHQVNSLHSVASR